MWVAISFSRDHQVSPTEQVWTESFSWHGPVELCQSMSSFLRLLHRCDPIKRDSSWLGTQACNSLNLHPTHRLLAPLSYWGCLGSLSPSHPMNSSYEFTFFTCCFVLVSFSFYWNINYVRTGTMLVSSILHFLCLTQHRFFFKMF